jgi:hypothetical protein
LTRTGHRVGGGTVLLSHGSQGDGLRLRLIRATGSGSSSFKFSPRSETRSRVRSTQLALKGGFETVISDPWNFVFNSLGNWIGHHAVRLSSTSRAERSVCNWRSTARQSLTDAAVSNRRAHESQHAHNCTIRVVIGQLCSERARRNAGAGSRRRKRRRLRCVGKQSAEEVPRVAASVH